MLTRIRMRSVQPADAYRGVRVQSTLAIHQGTVAIHQGTVAIHQDTKLFLKRSVLALGTGRVLGFLKS